MKPAALLSLALLLSFAVSARADEAPGPYVVKAPYLILVSTDGGFTGRYLFAFRADGSADVALQPRNQTEWHPVCHRAGGAFGAKWAMNEKTAEIAVQDAEHGVSFNGQFVAGEAPLVYRGTGTGSRDQSARSAADLVLVKQGPDVLVRRDSKVLPREAVQEGASVQAGQVVHSRYELRCASF